MGEEVAETPVGSTIRNIVAAHHIATAGLQTGLVELLEVIPLPIVRLMPDNNLAVRAEIWPAIGRAPASATAPEVDSALVTGRAQGQGGLTALEAETSHEAAEETETHSAEAPEVLADTTDPVPVPTATAVPPAWDPGAVEAFEAGADVVVGDADERVSGKKRWGRCNETNAWKPKSQAPLERSSSRVCIVLVCVRSRRGPTNHVENCSRGCWRKRKNFQHSPTSC